MKDLCARAFLVLFLVQNLTLAADPSTQPATTSAPSSAPAQEQHVLSDRFGLNAHLRHDPSGINLLPTIAQGGFSMLRCGDQWNGIEKKKGVYAVDSLTEQTVDGCRQLGIEPLFLLAYGNPLYKNNLDPDKFADFSIWLMDHYKGRIKYWEVWNEPNNFFFRKQYGGNWNGMEKDGKESPWVGKFADFVTTVASRIKAVHPEVKLMTGNTSVTDIRLLRDHPKMWEHIDILSIHPYQYRLPPELQPFGGDKMLARDGVALAGPDHSFSSVIKTYRDTLTSIGHPDMPIWITEVGYSTFSPRTPNRLWAGMTENAQAIYDARFGILAASLGVEKTLFYVLVDSGDNDGEVEDRFGLLHRDLTPKASYVTLQRLNALMPGDTRPIALSVKIKRPAPTTQTDSTAWDSQTIDYLDEPQICSFKRPDGKLVVFLWRSGRIYADFQDELCELQVDVSAQPLHVLEAGRVGSGEKVKTKPLIVKDTLVVPGLRYGADPIYLLLQ